jgi:hypothetical protein
MSNQTDLRNGDNYLERNDFLDVYLFLIASIDNLNSRANLLDKSIFELSQSLENLLSELSQDCEKKQAEITQKVKELHYMELEIIQRINIFVELMTVYYHYIRVDIRKLPYAVGDKHDFLSSEFDFIENQDISTIKSVFKYPNVEKFNELTPNERIQLDEGLNESIKIIETLFKDVLKFKRNFKQVYNKYKHVMAEVTGAFALHKEKGILESRFYVRHKVKDNQYKIYTIPLSPEIISYFSVVSRNILNLFGSLLDNQLLYLSNEGRDFIPRNLFFKCEDTGKRINEITLKIESCTMPNYNSILKINKASMEGQQRMSDAFRKNCVYVMTKDIYDKDSLKKRVITSRST